MKPRRVTVTLELDTIFSLAILRRATWWDGLLFDGESGVLQAQANVIQVPKKTRKGPKRHESM